MVFLLCNTVVKRPQAYLPIMVKKLAHTREWDWFAMYLTMERLRD
jgi:hypothetical protein